MQPRGDTCLPARAVVDRLVEECRTALGALGQIVAGSGSLQAPGLALHLHSDFGPAGQDKDENQDYALAWQPQKRGGGPIRLAVAIADGVTSSFRSDWAAAMACWAALRELILSGSTDAPQERAKRVFRAAGGAIGRVAAELASFPETSCPPGEFQSTWKYILQKGNYLQTTLMLAWVEGEGAYLAQVGDGGAAVRQYSGTTSPACWFEHVLARSDLETHVVHALGPANRDVQALDSWAAFAAAGSFQLALYTDGIARGIHNDPRAMFGELEGLMRSGTDNASRDYVSDIVRKRPQDFEDNLTLAVLWGSGK